LFFTFIAISHTPAKKRLFANAFRAVFLPA
jgi:hypothetical protein